MLAIAMAAFTASPLLAQPAADTATSGTAATTQPVVEMPAGTKILLDLRSAVNTKSARAGATACGCGWRWYCAQLRSVGEPAEDYAKEPTVRRALTYGRRM